MIIRARSSIGRGHHGLGGGSNLIRVKSDLHDHVVFIHLRATGPKNRDSDLDKLVFQQRFASDFGHFGQIGGDFAVSS